LLYDIDFTREKQNTLFLCFTLIKHGFLTNQSAHRFLAIL